MDRVFDSVQTYNKIVTSKHSPLSINGELVYSLLCYRYRRDIPVTYSTLARDTGLHRYYTVVPAVAELEGHALARRYIRRIEPIQPNERTAEWFAPKKAKPQAMWFDRFQFFPVPFHKPGLPLTPRQLVIYATIVSLNEWHSREVTLKFLATLTGLNLGTVKAGVRRLYELDLVRKLAGNDFYTPLLAPDKLQWFRQTGDVAEPEPEPAVVAPQELPQFLAPPDPEMTRPVIIGSTLDRHLAARAAQPKPPEVDPEEDDFLRKLAESSNEN